MRIRNSHHVSRIQAAICLLCVLTGNLLYAQQKPVNEYLNLSFEELTNLDVTSVTGVEEQWFHAPAAVYVITQEDIQRTGHQSLAELLRLVPGIDVTQASSNGWSIGARGVKGNYGDSLLMLIDGRSLHDPLQSFISWDTQDMVLNDIKNIEVIRGPGATLWGSKAVNGVINVTTKTTRDTQGWFLSGITGNHDRANLSMRYGGQLDEDTYFRVWTKYANRGPFKKPNGSDHHDDWDLHTSGFRIDTQAPDGLDWMIKGGIAYSGHMGDMDKEPITNAHFQHNDIISDGAVFDAYIQGTISKQVNDRNKWSITASYVHSVNDTLTDLHLQRDSVDIDYRHRLATSENQLFVWGASSRVSSDHTRSNNVISYDPADALTYDLGFYIQSSTNFFDDHLSLVIGSKFEYNNFSGFEYHPSIRTTWSIDNDNTLWAAVSRAVRAPSRSAVDRTVTPFYADASILAGGPPSGFYIPLTLSGNDEIKSEKLIANELGYRTHLTKALSLDTAAFVNDYSQLISISQQFNLNNNLGGEVYGGEINAVWEPAPTLRVEAGYSYAKSFLKGDLSEDVEESYPENHFHLRTYLDIGNDLECHGALYYTGRNETFDADPYFRLDLGLTWHMNEHTSLSLWGQNLIDGQHLELSDPTQRSIAAEVPRAIYLQLNLTY